MQGCEAPEFRFDREDATGIVKPEVEVCDHGVRDELGRLPGEALWPEVRPLSFLLRQLVDMTTRIFMGLFQGRPQRAGGAIFMREWFRYCELVEGKVLRLFTRGGELLRQYALSQCRIFQIVDLASGDTTTLRSGITRAKPKRDYFVDGTFALCPGMELALLDIYRDDKIDGTRQIPMIASLRSKWNAGRIGIEAVAYQWTAVQNAVATGLPAVAIERGTQSKEVRAWPVATRMTAGQVFFLRSAPWLRDFEEEIVKFPAGANDDQVDVLSDAGDVVMQAIDTPKPQGVYVP